MSTEHIKQNIAAALAALPDTDFPATARGVLETLGYHSELTPDLRGSVAEVVDALGLEKKHTNAAQNLSENVRAVGFLFQLGADEIDTNGQHSLDWTTASFEPAHAERFNFVAVELHGTSYARGQYAEFTREMNAWFNAPTVILFKTADNRLTLAFVHRRQHKHDPSRDVLGSVSLIREINPARPHRAHVDSLAELALDNLLGWMNSHNRPRNFDGLLAAWLDTLNTEALNKRFYTELFDWFEWAVAEATFPTQEEQVLPPQEHVIRLITRLLFVWFLKEKGLVADDLFNETKIAALLNNYDRDRGDTYYRAVLQNLFFATLNTEMDRRGFSTTKHSTHRNFSRYRYQSAINDPDTLLSLFAQTPFINGGLFDCLDSEEGLREGGYRIDCFSDNARHSAKLSLPNRLFFDPQRGIFPLLNHYKFTVEENTPVEQEVALDPELLGKVFENLLAAYNPETRETARKQTGSYYTPRPVVDYMVDEALIAALAQKCRPTDGDTTFWQERLRYLLNYEDAFNDADELFDPDEAHGIVRAIADLTVLDPAVGSGAFPMGVLHKLTLALGRLDPDNTRWQALQKERARQRTDAAFETTNRQERDAELLAISETFDKYSGDFGRKLYLIQNSIFGVDIQPIACQIAKLRFFISLAIEQEPDREANNFGIKPLPNLETRFIAADTLLTLRGERMLTSEKARGLERQLLENRERHFHATTRRKKLEYKKKDRSLREELAKTLEGIGFPADDANKIAQWDPYDQNAKADWFDAEYMFGNRDGFDAVIGNPPYVSHDKISKQLKTSIKERYQSYQPFADLYCYFIEKAVELQNKRGVFSLITSNSYLRAEYGKPVRKLLRSKNVLLKVLNIEESQVFESAIVNVAIVVSCKSTNLSDASCTVVNSPFSTKILDELVRDKGFDCPQAYFDSRAWSLTKPELVPLQRKLESSGKTLEQLGVKIRLGIATGSNEAFIIDEKKKRELCQKNSVNSKIIKPVLRGRDISRYVYTLPGLYLLLAKNGVDVARDYPDIYSHLESFGNKFKKRGAQGQHWTNLRACSFYDDFKKEKIVWIELTDSGRFALCNEEIYLLNSAYFLLPPSDIDSKFLLGVLNSSTIRFYLGLIAETSGMGTSRWINNYVKQFPIPPATPEQQTPIINLVTEVLEAKDTDPLADTDEMEAKIDRLVCGLYGLTAGEIGAAEGER